MRPYFNLEYTSTYTQDSFSILLFLNPKVGREEMEGRLEGKESRVNPCWAILDAPNGPSLSTQVRIPLEVLWVHLVSA